jgi:hypothetical protein
MRGKENVQKKTKAMVMDNRRTQNSMLTATTIVTNNINAAEIYRYFCN